MKGKVGLLLATSAGIIGGKYLFEPLILEQKEKERESKLLAAAMPSTPPAVTPKQPLTLQQHQQPEPQIISSSLTMPLSAPPPSSFIQAPHSSLTPSAIANTRTLACLPSTEISRSAHPDDAAKIMDEPLPLSPLIAKKIPSKEDSGEMQAEPYTRDPDGVGLFGKVKFW
ncbi:hypothetical protein H072_1893 [Dactylellina haptotyla CBS 200.50]|uniref:Uncharacterized protein n=1 Tax=Dactylellina haptotyla (strain CBS 200.50) TaxID=1284197 RepID=S8AT39_DACHA|nr:hypothetical protein H072_1893 [Dactylellina haptotyla CBS 200.50]